MTVFSLKSPASHAVESYFSEAARLREAGRFRDAKDILQRILSMKPNHDGARLSLALTSFLMEDWRNAWEYYEWRLRTHDLMPKPPPTEQGRKMVESINAKRWHHGSVPRDLLIFTEQGFGDVLHFSRFIPGLVRQGGRVTLITDEKLFGLLGSLSVPPLLQPKTQRIHIGPQTRWVPLMSLARALELTSPSQFVPEMPYLRAEAERVERWRARIGSHGFKIGVCWQGNPDPTIDQGRSMPLAALAPLAALPGVRLISLQKGAGEEQILQAPFALETLGPEFDAGPYAFLDTAAVMMSLDLVVSVCTSVAHLAGALNRPCFILLKKYGADWRWLHQRIDSVWYPTVTLFRQERQGEWDETCRRVAEMVTSLVYDSGVVKV